MESTPRRDAITWRSIAFSLLGILLMSGLAGYHDSACTAGPPMIGNHLPGGALAYLLFVGLVWNGLAGRMSRRLALGQKELVAVLVATLAACFPPTSGCFRFAFRVLMLPWYYLPGHPDWAEHGVLEAISPALFPSPGPGASSAAAGSPEFAAYQRVYQGYFSGLAQGGRWLPLWELPLREWLGPVLRWGPLVFLVSLTSIALQFVMHRQWARHEQLGYPVAQVMGRFCTREDGRPGVPDLFRDRLFWWGFAPVFLFYALDLVAAKYPSSFPAMNEVFPNFKRWWMPVYETFPALRNTGWYFWVLCGQTIFFSIIGAAYFVSSEISLTMGLSAYLISLVGLVYYYVVGVPLGGARLEASCAGAYVGYTLMLLYTGRAYFRAVFAAAFGGPRSRSLAERMDVDPAAVLAARVLVLAYAGTLVMLRIVGFEWGFAVVYSLLLFMVFLVFSRLLCETGIPFLSLSWAPMLLPVTLFGTSALGPRAIVLGHWSTGILMQTPHESLMPYVATGVHVADAGGLRLKRVFWFVVAAVAVALGVAFLAAFHTQYNVSGMTDGAASGNVVTLLFDSSAKYIREIKDIGDYPLSSTGSFWERLRLVRWSPSHIRFFVAGILMVVCCSAVRFKFSKFPIHPALFLVWGSYAANSTYESFLIGWFVKALVVRFGGGRAYQRLKPLFIGLIAGEIVFVGAHVAYDLVYMAVFGAVPTVGIQVLPN